MNKDELRGKLAQGQQSLANLERGVGECIRDIEKTQLKYLCCQRQGLYGQVREQRQRVRRLEKQLLGEEGNADSR